MKSKVTVSFRKKGLKFWPKLSQKLPRKIFIKSFSWDFAHFISVINLGWKFRWSFRQKWGLGPKFGSENHPKFSTYGKIIGYV